MAPLNRSSQYLVAVLLAGTLLRAFVPAGYMPAAPGKGLLFELCHDGVPPAIMSALGGHDDHAHHVADAHADGVSGCNIGHLLSLAVIDAVDIVEPLVLAPVSFRVAGIPRPHVVTRTRAFSARAPPVA